MPNRSINSKIAPGKIIFVMLFILALALSACGLINPDPGALPAKGSTLPTKTQNQDNPLPPKNTKPPAAKPTEPDSTFTQEPPAFTPTPYVMISKNTNCRTGPASVYDWLHTYLTGDQALILGKSADGFYWFVRDENGINRDCWLWGEYATPVGDTAYAPIFTPPPTPIPTPDFTVSYETSDCGAGSCWLWFKIGNSGSYALESVKVYTKNLITNDVAVYVTDIFQASIGGSNINKIQPSVSAYTHSQQLPNPSGDKVYVVITACELDSLAGQCQVRNLTVTP
jgi:hypothetical protein